MERFTKGDWIQCFANGIIIQTEATGYGICRVIGSLEADRANAALIAAAPEMYEMLSKLSSQLTDINAHGAVNDIEKLLAKARGE